MTDNRPSQLPTRVDLPAGQSAKSSGDAPESAMLPRFHTAHPVFGSGATGTAEPARDVLLAAAGKHPGHIAEHVQQQAAELAQQLDTRERELSHWEATLNARSAAHDDQVRSARLWWQEQQLDLAAREHELQQQSHQVRQQAAQLERQQADWEAERRTWEQTLEQQRRQCEEECAATRTLNEQLRQLVDQQHEVAQQQRACDLLRAELERSRAGLHARESNLNDDRCAWELERERQQQRTLQQRMAIAQHWRFRGQTLHLQQRSLQQRREQLDQRQQALEQQQAEVRDAQHELLELRLAIELTRRGLSASMPPHELTAIERCVREFLADQTAALEATRAQQRQELHTLANSLAQQQEALAARQTALQRWAQTCQHELDTRTAQLDLRERQLDQLHQQLARDKQAWLAALDEELAQATKKASCP